MSSRQIVGEAAARNARAGKEKQAAKPNKQIPGLAPAFGGLRQTNLGSSLEVSRCLQSNQMWPFSSVAPGVLGLLFLRSRQLALHPPGSWLLPFRRS